MRLTHIAAQHLMLASQGLSQARADASTKEAVLDVIRRMGALQIDTIHIVARSPYLVLWSRLGDYDPRWLDELLAEQALFEYWSHAACFLPIEDWPIYRRLMLDGMKGWKHAHAWLADNAEVAERVLRQIRENGAVKTNEFERTDGQKGSWWNWKPEKMALEALFYTGELMIKARHNFHRVYDLRTRLLPDWDDSATPTLDEAERALTLKAVAALGVATPRWVADYFYLAKARVVTLMKQLSSEGAVIPVEVEGWDGPAYIHSDNLALAQAASEGRLTPTLTTLLSPFDPLVNDRARALALFNFDYRIECYTPAAKRQYGYFTLPILQRGRLIGRLDPKAFRKEGVFEVKALHLEPSVVLTDELVDDLATTLRACAAWHTTPQVVVRWSNHPQLMPLLNDHLKP